MNPSATIRLRPANFGDMTEIGQVTGKAVFEDNIHGDLMQPYRKQFPDDFNLSYSRQAQLKFWDYRCRQVVAVHSGADGRDVIAGYAQWARYGKGGEALDPPWYDARKLAKPMTSAILRLTSTIWPNRAAHPDKIIIRDGAWPFIKDCWSGEHSESWYLGMLAVHPEFQGKGVGRLLVQDGVERSDREGVCTSVISARGKEAFYQKCGFDVEDGHVGMGEGNPLAGVDGGRMFWRMPKT